MTKKVLCGYCGGALVPLKDWNKRCKECQPGSRKYSTNSEPTPQPETKHPNWGGARVNIISRDPAAVIETEHGAKVFVDKFGREVDNPGYDLRNDPHGRDFTNGKRAVEGKTIL